MYKMIFCRQVSKYKSKKINMQSVSHPIYSYDSTGKLISYTPSGAANDVVAEHVMLDTRLSSPRSLIAGGLKPTILNTPQLFTPPLSLTSPPVVREQTVSSKLGYASYDTTPEIRDIYSITQAKPVISLETQRKNNARKETPSDGSM
jgi:hypothetical protein